MSHRTSTRPSRQALAALAVGVLVLAGCASGGDDASPATTTKAPASSGSDGSTTTTEADGGDDETTTTASSGQGGDLTLDDLEAILPEASDVGADWTEDEPDPADDSSDQADDETDKAFAEQCPELENILPDSSNDDEVSTSFTGPEDRSLEVSLALPAEDLTDDAVDEIVAAINACGKVSDTDSEGFDTSMTLKAVSNDAFGDSGLTMNADVTVKGPGMDQPITIAFAAQVFQRGPVQVFVTGIGGLDMASGESVPFDAALLAQQADAIDQDVADLVG